MLRAPAGDSLVLAMTRRDDELRVRPGRIRDKSFVGRVMRAAKKAGHTGKRFGGGNRGPSRSTFGRGRRAALSLSAQSTSRRVVIKARVVRHHGTRFRSAPLATHLRYLRREGVTREGNDARMFDATGDDADAKAFSDRCADDRHHFRFIVSPEDAARMADLRAFTRELMQDAERDLGTKLDWVAVDHWNTDNPHIHVLVRGRADDGKDLVISRDYISSGLRARAAERAQIELGPRAEQEIKAAQRSEVGAEYWTALDGALQAAADEGSGIADLRPGAVGGDDTRLLLVGRAAKLERLGLADQIAPGRWTLRPNLELTLRELSVRGDIIKTMHRAMSGGGREADVTGFALHGGAPAEPILGRLSGRGLHDELNGSAYAIIEGVDGRTHHVRFPSVEMTGDALLGAIVETRSYDDARGRKQVSLAVRSDLSIETQVTAPGATWLDRRLLDRDAIASNAAFGAEVGAAMERRADYLIGEGLARRQNQRVVFARNLLETLRRREIDEAIAKLSAETGLTHQPSAEGEHVSGTYRTRLVLASGRFAMIDDGLGFQLVPWRPALEQHLGQHVSGVMARGGGVEWDFDRRRGLGL
jgi:type IV secretory pathway VirD2 relaxase